jgi:hypothetical protein
LAQQWAARERAKTGKAKAKFGRPLKSLEHLPEAQRLKAETDQGEKAGGVQEA